MLHVVILSSAHPISGGEREEPPSPHQKKKERKGEKGEKKSSLGIPIPSHFPKTIWCPLLTV